MNCIDLGYSTRMSTSIYRIHIKWEKGCVYNLYTVIQRFWVTWVTFSKKQYSSLHVQYNNAFRMVACRLLLYHDAEAM